MSSPSHKCLLAGWMLIAISAGQSEADAAELPNIVIVLADDLGYGDVQALNAQSAIPTPNLNAIAASGLTFTDAHTPSAVCTPTRYGLMTGRYCWRSRLKRGVLDGYGERLIEPNRQTMASLLKSAGYRTGVIGKWHLGLGWKKTGEKSVDLSAPVADAPNELGFDFSHIIPASLDFPPYAFIENGKVTDPTAVEQPSQKFPAFLRAGQRAQDFVMEEALDHLTTQAVQFISESAKQEQPFFLYFPLTAPHKPVLPHPRFRGKTALSDYGDFVAQVDWVAGQVRDALTAADAADNTLLIVTSDNGSFMYRYDSPEAKDHVDDVQIQGFRADRHRSNGPWRGTKADIWEAGHRVPCFVSWPGVIKQGSKDSRTICLTDLMATVAEITGAKLKAEAAEDSYSLLPLLKQQELEAWKRPPVVHHSVAGMFAIRDGNWKLIAGNGSGGRQQPRGQPFAEPFQLYDLATDPDESEDVARQHPDVVERLTKTLETFRESGRSVSR